MGSSTWMPGGSWTLQGAGSSRTDAAGGMEVAVGWVEKEWVGCLTGRWLLWKRVGWVGGFEEGQLVLLMVIVVLKRVGVSCMWLLCSF
jgi:hypothetical protein